MKWVGDMVVRVGEGRGGVGGGGGGGLSEGRIT